MDVHNMAEPAPSSDVDGAAVGGLGTPDIHHQLESLRVVVGERLEASAQINAERLSTALEALRQWDEQGGSRSSLVGLVSVLLDEFVADVRSATEIDGAVEDDLAQHLNADLQGLGQQFAADARALNAGEIGARDFMPGAEFTAHASVQSLGTFRDRARNSHSLIEQRGAEPLRERMH